MKLEIDVNIIVAYCNKKGIGKNNKLQWNIKKDMEYFKNLTLGYNNVSNKQNKHNNKFKNIVIMGRKTYQSIPEKFRPLKNRI